MFSCRLVRSLISGQRWVQVNQKMSLMSQVPMGRAVGIYPMGPPPPPPPPLPLSQPLVEPWRGVRVDISAPPAATLIDSMLVPNLSGLGIGEKMELPKAPNPVEEMRAEKHLIRIRREKMNKHKLRKFRKRMLALIKKHRLRREIKKEKAFRVELLAQIKEAERFDAETYVKSVLKTIQSVPKPETLYERRERIRDLCRKYRSQTMQIKPKFEDPVP